MPPKNTLEPSKTVFHSKYVNKYIDPGEKLPRDTMTEQAHIPQRVRIEEMIFAGHRLEEARKEQFDAWKAGEKDVFNIPVTRGRNIDLVDIHNATKELNERFEEKRKQIELLKDEKTKKKHIEEWEAEKIKEAEKLKKPPSEASPEAPPNDD